MNKGWRVFEKLNSTCGVLKEQADSAHKETRRVWGVGGVELHCPKDQILVKCKDWADMFSSACDKERILNNRLELNKKRCGRLLSLLLGGKK